MFNQENKLINRMKLVALLHGFISITYLPNMKYLDPVILYALIINSSQLHTPKK
jgi:hypothetical protein